MIKCYRMGSFFDERWPDDFYSNLIIVDESRMLKKEFLDEIAYRLKRGIDIKRALDLNTVGRYYAKILKSGGYTKVILKRRTFFDQVVDEASNITQYCISKIDSKNGALD